MQTLITWQTNLLFINQKPGDRIKSCPKRLLLRWEIVARICEERSNRWWSCMLVATGVWDLGILTGATVNKHLHKSIPDLPKLGKTFTWEIPDTAHSQWLGWPFTTGSYLSDQHLEADMFFFGTEYFWYNRRFWSEAKDHQFMCVVLVLTAWYIVSLTVLIYQ